VHSNKRPLIKNIHMLALIQLDRYKKTTHGNNFFIPCIDTAARR
jgi:hypothetical protein